MTGFYELLHVRPEATAEELRAAYQEQVAQVVRKQRAAEARQQDLAPIEARRAAIAEAWAVLSDPSRRRRYDRFRELSRGSLPATLDELWAKAGPSLVEPAAAAALEVTRVLTDLRVGESIADMAPAAESDVSAVRVERAREIARVEQARQEASRLESARADIARADVARAEARARTEGAWESEDLGGETRVAPEPPRLEAPRFDMPPPSLDMTVVAADPSRGAASPPPARVTQSPWAPAEVYAPVASEDIGRLLERVGPSGTFLRGVRELRRMTLERLSQTTRVSQRFLDALERDAFTELPGATFVRGYLKMSLRALEALPLGAETDEFVDGYMARFHRARG